MSTLSSSSSLDAIKASYADNASYEEDASVTKAKAFVTACRLLLLKLPRSAGHGTGKIDLAPELIQSQMQHAQRYVARANSSSNAGVKHLSFENLR